MLSLTHHYLLLWRCQSSRVFFSREKYSFTMATPKADGPVQERDSSSPLSDPSEADEVTVSISQDLLVELGLLAQKLNVKPSVALRYAISLTSGLYSEKEQGAKGFLKKGSKQYDFTLKEPNIFSKQVS